MKAKDVKKLLGITQQTLSKYTKEGLVKYHKINPYHYVYDEDSVYALIGNKKHKTNRLNISYSRVSTSSQKDQLKSQTTRIYESCISRNISLDKQIEDIKSGMDFNRKGFQELITLILKNEVNAVIVENKDRLVRFGFDTLEYIFKFYGTTIIVLNDQVENNSYEQELTTDLISIIHYFTMKSYSNRRKLNKIRKELESNHEND